LNNPHTAAEDCDEKHCEIDVIEIHYFAGSVERAIQVLSRKEERSVTCWWFMR